MQCKMSKFQQAQNRHIKSTSFSWDWRIKGWKLSSTVAQTGDLVLHLTSDTSGFVFPAFLVQKCVTILNPLSPIHRSYICVSPLRWRCLDFTMIPLFLPSPWQVFMLEHMMTVIERESRGNQEDRSTINFGCVWVRTPACAAGKYFI